MTPKLFRIEAPHFVAGLETKDRVVVRAAPVVKHMVGWPMRRVISTCKRKGWEVKTVHTLREARLNAEPE